MTLDQFKDILPKIIQKTLGGLEAQFEVAPTYRERYDLELIRTQNPQLASVMIVFFPDEHKKIRLVLIKRPDYSGYHANQISFTGGKKDVKDLNLVATAIRETNEEIGLKITEHQIFKPLTEVYIPPSNFLVQPFLAFISEKPQFTPNYEVEKIVTPLLSTVLNPIIEYRNTLGAQGTQWYSPGFVLEEEFVWGATAMMLSELRKLFTL